MDALADSIAGLITRAILDVAFRSVPGVPPVAAASAQAKTQTPTRDAQAKPPTRDARAKALPTKAPHAALFYLKSLKSKPFF